MTDDRTSAATTCTDIDGYGCCRTCGKRVECGRCRNPYDEDKDALGVCAECLAEALDDGEAGS